MIRMLNSLIAAFVLAAGAAQAAPLSPDPTGYWYNPNESGWGANIAQQGDVLFVTLFVYDEQRRPAWFVASNVKSTASGIFSGTLFKSSGSPFGGTFDPNAVTMEPVGAITLQYAVNFGGQASLRIDYTVNGLAVTKGVTRLTWNGNATRLPGAYVGGITYSFSAATLPVGCGGPPDFFPAGSAFHITMSEPDTIAMFRAEGTDRVDLVAGTYQQSGQFGVITGGLYRGIVVAPLKLADAQVTNLVVTDDGFVGHLRVVQGNCAYEGSIGAIRRP